MKTIEERIEILEKKVLILEEHESKRSDPYANISTKEVEIPKLKYE